jgi:hypothetical protein
MLNQNQNNENSDTKVLALIRLSMEAICEHMASQIQAVENIGKLLDILHQDIQGIKRKINCH